MEVLLESEEQMGRNKEKGRGKRQRPNGPPAPTPAAIANQTGRLLTEREAEWLDRLVGDPASFAAVEREVHDQARRQADLYVAGLLAKASEHPEMAQHVDKVTAEAEVPLRPVEKKTPPGGAAQYCSARNLHEIPNLFLFIDLHKGIGERHMAKSLHNRKP